MRILVIGSRKFADAEALSDALRDCWLEAGDGEIVTVVHGGSRGADRIAHRLVLEREHLALEAEVHPATQEREGIDGWALRNERMVALGADVVLAFFQNRASNQSAMHCFMLAYRAGLPILEFWGRYD